MIPVPHSLIGLVTQHEGVAGLYYGPTRDAWHRAAELSSVRHIVRIPAPAKRVLAIMPEMYTDLWTGAKGMYKSEPAVADGGEVVIYAPHIREVSHVHGAVIREVGYHCRDYFLKHWDRFRLFPGGILAHSTHVKGKALTTLSRASKRRASTSLWPQASPKRSVARSTLAISIPQRSTPANGARMKKTAGSSCRARARCSIALGMPPGRLYSHVPTSQSGRKSRRCHRRNIRHRARHGARSCGRGRRCRGLFATPRSRRCRRRRDRTARPPFAASLGRRVQP